MLSIAIYSTYSSHRSVLSTITCPNDPHCLSDGENKANVSAFIRTQSINFKVYPEKRIPSTRNWNTIVDIDAQNCTNGSIKSYLHIATNAQGEGTVIVTNNNQIGNGDYRFFIRGYSHLRKEFNCYTLNQINQNIDFTSERKLLLAGEVSNIFDNHINALDISVLIRNLYTKDYKSDLNQDSKVNSLDLSNQIYNLYQTGD